MACCLTHMHDLIWDFCSSDQRFARELVYSSHPASFRFHLTMDTLAFGYILPTTGRIRDFNPLETCAARRTWKKGLTKLISLNSVRPFCWFHTYYLITTRFRINNAKISRVIILLSNRTLSARKRPVYKAFQKFLIIQTPYNHNIIVKYLIAF